MPHSQNQESTYSFTQKVWIAGLIFSLIAVILLIFEATFNILILVLAGVLIACYFRGISVYLSKKTGWSSKITMLISVLGTFILVSGMFFLVGSTVSNQASHIEERLPEMVETLKTNLGETTLGREVVEQINQIQSSNKITSFLSRFFMTTFGGIGDIYIIILIGVFFTISPKLYKKGILHLVPPRKRETGEEVLKHLGTGLTKWLAGKFLAMLAVFILTAIVLIAMGFPMWLTLALLAGILNFIPNFGPLAAMIPAVLVGLTMSPNTALLVAALYTAVQLIESSFITPQAQQKLIQIPPALIIISQIFVGAMTGIWGIIFATPLVLIIIILVKDLYVKPMEKKHELTSKKENKD